ncbi:MAG TPA: selenocysteine-specific translation elongation factor [Burkholderiaceae bacterium]|nr:selenocysteine-specific translation elongation factor [Burkholderiaceae bacterium]
MIVGTAGHIDHGKTTLVRALTGVDTDRLPEEKQRGISIELGYAFLDPPPERAGPDAALQSPERIGFIDVPGHERLVHTMLAGATGIDLALLLVAADDGVMPQTREHLAVLSLLGIARGAVVITKTDRADAARLEAVRGEVAALLEGTPLHAAPRFQVSATTGDGIAPLRSWLFDQAHHAAAARDSALGFRLAIDRAFTLDGVGTVVTGTVHAGSVQVGDELELLPMRAATRTRVRSVHAQNRAVERALAGQRCALALAGVAKDAIARGQWLTSPAIALSSGRIDVQLTLWHGEAHALRSGTPVHVHLGASDTPGTVAILDGADPLPPGAGALAQLVLQRPIGAWHGDRVVLRDASASRTLAGGRVLDPFALARYRRTPQRIASLQAQAEPTAQSRLQALLAVSPMGVDLQRWARAEGQQLAALPALPERAMRAHAGGSPAWALDAAAAAAAHDAALAVLHVYHQRQPDELGPDAARLRRLALPKMPEPMWRALLAHWLAQGDLQQRGGFVRRPEHGVRLSGTEERIAQKVATLLAAAGFEGSWVRDLARDSRESEALMRTTLARLARRGELHQVVKDLFYPPATIRALASIARELGASAGSEVTAAKFRDATQLGRKRAIQVLEYFDRVGMLRRVGDVHRVRSDSDLFKALA